MNRAGAVALIVGAILSIFVFALHPAHAAVAPVVGPYSLSQIVHGAALAGAPLLAFGMVQVVVWLGVERPLAQLALVLALFAITMMIASAVVSDFVIPVSAKAVMTEMLRGAVMHGPTVHSMEQMPPLIQSMVALNRGFAQVQVFYLSIAILLIAFALRRHRLLAITGGFVGLAPVLWQLSGTFSPEITTMPWIVIPQSLWLMCVAAMMLGRHRERG